jgi:hypothetical protein
MNFTAKSIRGKPLRHVNMKFPENFLQTVSAIRYDKVFAIHPVFVREIQGNFLQAPLSPEKAN